MARRYLDATGIQRPGAGHLFRHTATTLMLEGGADIRFMQEFLGHADLNTTQLYTHVSMTALKAVHERTNPGARSEPRMSLGDEDGLDGWDRQADALLAAIDGEGEDCAVSRPGRILEP